MKTNICIILTLLTANVIAQNQVEVRYPYPESEVYNNAAKEKHTVSVYSKTRKNKHLEQTLYFNNKGLIDQKINYKSNGNVSDITQLTFNDSNKIVARRIIRNDKVRHLYTQEYKNLTLITQSKIYYKDTLTPVTSTAYEYTLNNKFKSITGYNRKTKESFRYEYDYYDNGSRREVRYFTKGKLKHSWVYDCDWKGELDNSQTVKICKNRVYNADSSFTEIFENTYKGKASKTIIKSSADGRVLENTAYDANGKMKWRSVYEYNKANKLVKHQTFKGNSSHPKSIELYEYAADSNLIASIRLDKNGDVKYKREFIYN